jgi:hypothetical protein
MWFWLVSAVLLIWNLIGCHFCIQQFRLGAEAMKPTTDYDRELYARLPGWYNYCYALAVGAGALGGVLLLLRNAGAYWSYIVSLVAVVIEFGYLFTATDVIAKKGFGKAVPFPAFIALVAALAIWFACCAKGNGWIA